MHYTVKTKPTILPLNVSDVQEYLRLDNDDDVNTVTDLIETARDIAQEYTNRTFITTEYVLLYDRLPSAKICDNNYIKLIKGSIINVSEVKVFNDDATTEVLVDYILTHDNMSGRLYPSLECGWTTDKVLQLRNAVQITYTAGYGTARGDVPAGLKNAMMQLIAFLYESREGGEIPATIMRGFDKFKIFDWI